MGTPQETKRPAVFQDNYQPFCQRDIVLLLSIGSSAAIETSASPDLCHLVL